MEKHIEAHLVSQIRKLGGMAYKFVSPANRGVSDRIVCMPDGTTWFVELKAPNGRLSPLQKVFQSEMARMQQKYVCLWSKGHIDEWLKELGYDKQ